MVLAREASMTLSSEAYIDTLPLPARLIADTVRREIEAAAPYAEFGMALGTPTWSHGARVVSVLPFRRRCTLHFWAGEQLDGRVPIRLRGGLNGPVRYLELRSILDVNSDVKSLISAAFAHQLERLAEEDLGLHGKAALPV
jgi:hypothetical protein